jgi:site-specific DNA-methyltransferase (adenine-specific)
VKPYYEEDGISIYCGDCREVLPLLGSVDSVVTDPPYGVGLTAKRGKARDGSVTIREGSYSFEDSPVYVSEVVVPIIAVCRALARCVAVTPGTRNLWLYPAADDMGCFYSAASTGLGRWGFACSQPILYYGSDPYLRTGKGARANSCGQTYPNDANEVDHPCAKPIRMMRWLVDRASLPGEIVLDPFMGSGTTLAAAKYSGRRAVGIEIEERYCEIAAKRLSQRVLPLGEDAA